jgi:hypothetical protein
MQWMWEICQIFIIKISGSWTEWEICNELRNKNNSILRTCHRNYSKIVTNVIKKAKRMAYDKCILNSHNKIKLLGIL